MKLFQIEEPDGSPVDTDAPGVAIGIDIGGTHAEVAVAVGGNAVVLETPLQAGEDVGTGALHRRAWDAATELLIGLFRAGIQRL